MNLVKKYVGIIHVRKEFVHNEHAFIIRASLALRALYYPICIMI